MNIAITGSIAYDRIMDFNDRFRDHIIPDKIHMLNVSFVLEKLEEKFGGAAVNIAYSLKLLGLDSEIVGSVGKDFGRYAEHLERLGLGTKHINEHKEEYTAVATMITDLDNNQISAFYPGALRHGHEHALPKSFGRDDMLVIAASSKQEIVRRCTEAHERGMKYIFDPGQQMSTLSSEELLYGAERARVAIFNDYEWQLYREKTSRELDDLTSQGVTVIVTRGEQGSVIYTKESDHDIEIAAAKPREVIDPTGAGDAYRAGIIAGMAHGWEWQEAGQVAAVVASFAVETYGTQEHSPSISDINERYIKNFSGESPLAEAKEMPPNQDSITYG